MSAQVNARVLYRFYNRGVDDGALWPEGHDRCLHGRSWLAVLGWGLLGSIVGGDRLGALCKYSLQCRPGGFKGLFSCFFWGGSRIEQGWEEALGAVKR